MRRKKRRIGMLLLLGALIWSCNRDKRGELFDIHPSSMSHEREQHTQTWMKFSVDETKQDMILILSSIAQYEPVSVLVSKADKPELMKLLGKLNTHHYPIKVLETKVKDPYVRDTGPTFVISNAGAKGGINFNPKREDSLEDLNITDFITTQTNAEIIRSNIVLNGNCFDVNGLGTALMTESCIINDDHNPYWDKEEIETELKLLLGLQKIIWLKGMEDEEITNAQTDFYARFVKEGVVLVHRNNDKESDAYELTRENIKILQAATDAKGKALEVVIIDAPNSTDHATSGYLGYYLCNRALIMQSFGDEEADYRAKQTLQFAFPDRTIDQLQIDAISSDEGTIHRVTQQEP